MKRTEITKLEEVEEHEGIRSSNTPRGWIVYKSMDVVDDVDVEDELAVDVDYALVGCMRVGEKKKKSIGDNGFSASARCLLVQM